MREWLHQCQLGFSCHLWPLHNTGLHTPIPTHVSTLLLRSHSDLRWRSLSLWLEACRGLGSNPEPLFHRENPSMVVLCGSWLTGCMILVIYTSDTIDAVTVWGYWCNLNRAPHLFKKDKHQPTPEDSNKHSFYLALCVSTWEHNKQRQLQVHTFFFHKQTEHKYRFLTYFPTVEQEKKDQQEKELSTQRILAATHGGRWRSHLGVGWSFKA